MRRRTHVEVHRLTAHLTDKQVFDRAQSLGHIVSVAPTASGARWQMRCSCQEEGATMTTRATKGEVYRQAMTHMRHAVADEDTPSNPVNGGVLPRKSVATA